MVSSEGSITRILERAAAGDEAARDELYAVVEDKLRETARRCMAGERDDHTLQATVLIDDAFYQLTDPKRPISWQHRRHFYRLAARAMRRLLIDHARRRDRARRGGGRRPQHLGSADPASPKKHFLELISLDEALEQLALHDRRLTEVVELHHFAGHTFGEVAALLGLSVATIKNDWAAAKAWLYRELTR